MLLCSIWFLDVIEPSLAMVLLCQYYVALMLLCIGSRTFSVGTDVFVPVCGFTDVIVQHLCLVLRVLEPVVGNDVVMPLGFIDVLNPLDTVVSHFFSLSSGILNKILSHMCGEIVLSNVFVQGGIVNPDKHGFLDGSCHIVLFSAKDLEIVHWCYIWPLMFGGGILEKVSSNALWISPNGSPRLSYIFFIAASLPTTITIDDTALVGHFIFILRWHKDVFECPIAFEIYSHTILLANVFDTFTHSRYIKEWLCGFSLMVCWLLLVGVSFLFLVDAV